MHQRAGLVVVVDVEGDAELDRRQRDAALEQRASGVEGGDGIAPRDDARSPRSTPRTTTSSAASLSPR